MTEPNSSLAATDPARAAQESTRDLVKLLISLGSAVVVLSATFTEKLAQGVGAGILVLIASWTSLAVSVYFGVTALSTLVHAQRNLTDTWADMTLPPMRNCWRWFLVGMVLLLLFAAIASGMKAFGLARESEPRGATCVGPAGPAGKEGPPGAIGARGEKGDKGECIACFQSAKGTQKK